MNYEKAYKEALERARVCREKGFSDGESLEDIFPELKESEDERIRETLANLIVADINELIKSADSRAYFQGVKEYLEDVRQFAYNKGLVDAKEKYEKEQKPVEWSEEDDLMRDAILNTLERVGDYGTIGMQKDWLKSLRPQPHWKPSKQQMKALKDVIDRALLTCRQQVPLESLYNDLNKLFEI